MSVSGCVRRTAYYDHSIALSFLLFHLNMDAGYFANSVDVASTPANDTTDGV